MTKTNATHEATEAANQNQIEMAVVDESLHADEHAERDPDGNSYGYCPAAAVPILYRYGTIIQRISPSLSNSK